MTSSPALTTKSIPSNSEPDIKLSPGSLSPSYGIYSPDSDFDSKYNPPMKHKESSGALHISTSDHFFPPGSPYVCSSPYWGNFGVSAPAQSTKTSDSSPSFHHSPNMQSSGGYSSNGYYSRNQTPALSASSWKSNTPIRVAPSPSSPPILQAPTPSSLKPATSRYNTGGRQLSTKSDQMSRPFHQETQQDYAPIGHGLSSKVQKSNSKRTKTPNGFYEKLMAAAEGREITDQERVLLQFAVRDGIPWIELRDKFNAIFPGKPMQAPALQMKKKRLVEKLQGWTEVEIRALEASVERNGGKWATVSKDMKRCGAKSKWSAEACQKQWEEMRPKDNMSQYEMAQIGDYRRHRTSPSDFTQQSLDQQSWSDGAESVHHSPFAEGSGQLISALSSTTMDDTRSRTASDASVHLQIQQQQFRHIQQQIDYGQHNHQPLHQRQQQQSRIGSWASGA
ncbi:hypothetical protein ONS95_004732 [Cadophora gregata]|uniref:uncharacterized protein n=1 Tax=Cadophora gregata TaxID=51156 RepID=UPI0026DBBDD7|nr:uncharacterized protein ONS95_004732 [Cadophora gregata]KAK0104443.1 hypothetical protein ONS95_004732 [Cadophora gregata]